MVHCPQTLEAVRKYFDANATEFITQGKRKYLMPMDKQMRRKLSQLAKPYPKNDGYEKPKREQYKKQ